MPSDYEVESQPEFARLCQTQASRTASGRGDSLPDRLPPACTLHRVIRGLGVVAGKNTIGYTLATQESNGAEIVVEDEQELTTPGVHAERGQQLAWLLAEARQLLARLAPDKIVMQKPGAGFTRERVEVESLIQVAAAEAGMAIELLVNDSVRARLGVARAAGAFDAMLQEPDAAARSNNARRERYLFAKLALKP